MVQSLLKKFQVPVKIYLVVPQIMIIIIAVSLVGTISIFSGRNSIETLTKQLRLETSKRIEENLIQFITVPQKINKLNTNLFSSGNIDLSSIPELQQYFSEQVQVFDSVTSIYFGSLEGGLVGSGREGPEGTLYVTQTQNLEAGTFEKYSMNTQGNPDQLLASVPDFDARTRDWYQKAVENQRPSWSEVYILFTGQDLAVAASEPVYTPSGELLGVVSVDIFVSHLTSFLQEIEISENGQSFIFEPSGELVAISTGEQPISLNVEQPERIYLHQNENSIIREAGEYIQEISNDFQSFPEQQSFEYQVNGDRYYLQLVPVKDEYGIELLIGVVIPESDFMYLINQNFLNTGIAIALSFIVSVLISIPLSNWIIQPLKGLLRFSQSISNHDWEKKTDYQYQDQRIKRIICFISINGRAASG